MNHHTHTYIPIMMRVVGRSFSGSYFAAFLQWAKNGGNDAMNLEEEKIFSAAPLSV